MQKNRPLSYAEFLEQGINISHICRELWKAGADYDELRSAAQQARYIFVPGTRGYYLLEFFVQLWIIIWMGILSALISALLVQPPGQSPTPVFKWLFAVLFILSSTVSLYVYHSPDYYNETDFTRGEQAYYLYLLLNKKFSHLLKQIIYQPA